jgi:hypothetical protein
MIAADQPVHPQVAGIPVHDIVFFIAVMASVLTLGMALAHLFALPNKMAMSRDDYFISQAAYLGWSQIWIVLLVQLVSLVALAVVHRHEPVVLWSVVVAVACFIAAQVLFWMFTFPANKATQNWTVIPDNWETLRRSWEYSHAAAAVIGLAGMAALVIAGLTRMRG